MTVTQTTINVNTVETKAAFARRLGMSRQAIGRHASTKGFPVAANGMVRVAAALDWLEKHIRGHEAKTDELGDGGLIDARIKLTRVQTARQELALARDRGELIPYNEAKRALMGFMRLNRECFLGFAVRHGPAIAAKVGCDEATLCIALDVHLREALTEACDNALPFIPTKEEMTASKGFPQ